MLAMVMEITKKEVCGHKYRPSQYDKELSSMVYFVFHVVIASASASEWYTYLVQGSMQGCSVPEIGRPVKSAT